MLADERGHAVELRTTEAAALMQADGIEPELGHVLVALHVEVRRLGPVAGVEEEPVGASPEHGLHAERWHRERLGGNGGSGRAPRTGEAARQKTACRRLTPKVELRAKYHQCGEAASLDRPAAPTHVIRQRRDCHRRGSRRPCITAMTDGPREWITKYTTYGK